MVAAPKRQNRCCTSRHQQDRTTPQLKRGASRGREAVSSRRVNQKKRYVLEEAALKPVLVCNSSRSSAATGAEMLAMLRVLADPPIPAARFLDQYPEHRLAVPRTLGMQNFITMRAQFICSEEKYRENVLKLRNTKILMLLFPEMF